MAEADVCTWCRRNPASFEFHHNGKWRKLCVPCYALVVQKKTTHTEPSGVDSAKKGETK